MKQHILIFILALGAIGVLTSDRIKAADTNTVSSTVVTDKAPPTASAPSIVVNNNDVCRSGMSVGAQTGFLGLSTGHTVIDKNCERIKLARSLYGMGMKVAGVSLLCQDARVFDAMMMSGTPCPYSGSIGADAMKAWNINYLEAPEDSLFYKNSLSQAEKEEQKLEEQREEEERAKRQQDEPDEWNEDGYPPHTP